MNFLKRSLLSIKAKKGRTLLLILVFSAILIFVLAGLTIRSAALSATETAKKSVGATATLSVNREASMKKSTTSSSSSGSSKPSPGSFSAVPVTLKDAKAIAALSQVKSYNFLSSTSAGATDDITPISSSDSQTDSTDSSTTDSTATEQNAPPGGRGGGANASSDSGSKFGPGNAQGDFTISGVRTSADAAAFSAGTASLTSGTAITAEDEGTNNVLIEATLADANDLKVGDTFTISNATDEDVTYKVTIKGIYTSTSTGDSMGMNFNFMNPANTIYTSYTFANTLKGDDYKTAIDSASYTLNDPEKLATFTAAAEKLIDTDTYSLQTNDQAYQQMLQPLDNVSSFAKNIVILVSVAGVIILALIVMMTIRERKYEIGVLLSIGEKRTKVIAQFFAEMLFIMAISLLIASASGKYVGNIVGQQLLSQQTEQAASSQTVNAASKTNGRGTGAPGGGRGGMMNQVGNVLSDTTTQQVKSLNITLSPTEIGQLGGIGLAICLLSVLLSSIGIVRLQPKKILTS